MKNRKRISLLFVCMILILGIFFIAMYSNTVWQQPLRFQADAERIESLSMPENLPEYTGNYQEWTRETEWMKVIDSSGISVYANNVDLENLYLQWGNYFFKIGWLQARTGEWDIKLQILDIDDDKKEELIITAISKGSAHWEIDELRIIEQVDENTWVDVIFPLEKISSWIINNIKLDNRGNVRFLEKELFCNGEEASDKSINGIPFMFFELNNSEIALETIIESIEMSPVCKVIISFSYRNQEFQIMSYDLMKHENI